MSRRKKKKKNRVTGFNVHHICYQGRYWNRGYARAIRNAFTRRIPIAVHNELHGMLNTVPVPSGELLKHAWELYLEDRETIDSYGVTRACAWLYVNIPDARFREAMQTQIDFFATKKLP